MGRRCPLLHEAEEGRRRPHHVDRRSGKSLKPHILSNYPKCLHRILTAHNHAANVPSRTQNVAPHDDDLSDPAYFRKQTSAFATRKRSPKPAPQDVGAPGCTDRERDRFSVILRQGMLVDAFAHIRPADHARIFTWRAVSGGFGGRAMRIDHCIVSHPLLAHVRDVVVLGHNNLAGFMGSDHCPVLIVMHARTHSEGQGDAPAPVAVRARPAHAVGDAGHLSDAAENEDKASDTRDAALNEGVGSSDWNSSKQAEDILDANSSS